MKPFLWLAVGILLALTFTQTRLILFNDLSILPVDPLSNADYGRSSSVPLKRSGVYLITYADGAEIFYKNQHALAVSALNRGIDFILNYRRSHLDSTFIQKYQAILNQPKGAGYWLWKPWIIYETLKTIPNGSYAIYADTGFIFTQSVVPYLEKMKNHDVMLVAYEGAVDGFPLHIAKRDIFAKLNCDEPACWKGVHVWAGFLVLRNTEQARQFVHEWLELCCNEMLLTDKPGALKPHSQQRVHQHDEAILSVLYNLKIKEGEKYLTLLPVANLRNFTFWHHRHPGKDYESLWYKSTPRIRGIERDWILNSWWMKKIREVYFS